MKNEQKYTKFSLVREMMQTPEIIRRFKPGEIGTVVEEIKKTGKLFFTGEGSGRIFPAKNAIVQAMKAGADLALGTEGSYQAAEYDLSDFVVFASSNSGKTKETIEFCKKLKQSGHERLYGLTANEGTPLEAVAKQTFVISCGDEDAIAATKSYIEQGLFYQSLIAQVGGMNIDSRLSELAGAFEQGLEASIDGSAVDAVAKAKTVYLAGRNDGVAEELAVKANEVVRKKSAFLEGTSYLHGAQEVMTPEDVVILVGPYDAELEKTRKVLEGEAGVKVIAIGGGGGIFPAIELCEVEGLRNYAYIAAGWNLLVEAGISLGLNLDEAERARKVGNVYEDESS